MYLRARPNIMPFKGNYSPKRYDKINRRIAQMLALIAA